jgi:hypothetical protein
MDPSPRSPEFAAAAIERTEVVFLLDEFQFLDRTELDAMIAALHPVAQRELPLTFTRAD